MDERVKILAHNLVNYSCEVKEGDKVYIHYLFLKPLFCAEVLIF